LSSFGVIVLPTIVSKIPVASLPLPPHTISLTIGAIAAVGLTLSSWQDLQRDNEKLQKRREIEADQSSRSFALTAHSLPLTTAFSPTESLLARFQLLSACFVAFAHGSNDVGNAVAPLAAIAYIHRTGTVPLEGFEVPLWILVVGGIGIVSGLAVWGKKVIATIGEEIISLQPSGGFCAELATATTILLASRLGLPVSTSHALVGGVVGIGLVQTTGAIRLQTLSTIGLAWLVTVPLAAALGAAIFSLSRWLLPFQ
jgi:PiT family inorganic phosphate transporter